MKRTPIILGFITIITGLIIIWLGWGKYYVTGLVPHAKQATVSSGSQDMKAQTNVPSGVVQDDSGKVVKYWYDPMVPTQQFDKPGKSPFMDMQLQPKYAEADDDQSGVAISSQMQQNFGIRLAKASMRSFGSTVMAVGRIEANERLMYVVQTRVPGFVERLWVRAMGDPVKRGQKIAEVYAPTLLAAEQEYLALQDYAKNATAEALDPAALAQAARNRLQLLGMSENEINTITRSGKPSRRFGVYAPASGVVAALNVAEGAELMAGASLMQISDLSRVWLLADVPERNASQLKLGDVAEIELQGNATVIQGKVNYIYPALDPITRSLQIRVELPNQDGHLLPGMYANVKFSGASQLALAVPTEAVIATGSRKVVITRINQQFQPVNVTTGSENGDYTEITEGLSEGNEVVISGQFLIDSEATLSGVLSKLSQAGKKDDAVSDMTMQDPASANMRSMTNSEKTTEKMPIGHGKVMGIDIPSGKVTLKHEPIPELGWPAMTMGFTVKDAQSLKQLKMGDTVRFKLKSNPKNQTYDIEHIDQILPSTPASKAGEAP